MIQPQHKTVYKQWIIYIFKTEQLPDMDSFGKEKKVNKECEGYVECHYLGIVKKTKFSSQKNDSVIWMKLLKNSCFSKKVYLIDYLILW